MDGALADRFGGTSTGRFNNDVDSNAPFEEPEVVVNLRAGPHDWSAPKERGLDVGDGADVVKLGTSMPIGEEVPEGYPISRFLWMSAGFLLFMGILAAFDLAPGSMPLAFAWGAAEFVCAGVVTFLTSPRSEDIDPLDGGARFWATAGRGPADGPGRRAYASALTTAGPPVSYLSTIWARRWKR